VGWGEVGQHWTAGQVRHREAEQLHRPRCDNVFSQVTADLDDPLRRFDIEKLSVLNKHLGDIGNLGPASSDPAELKCESVLVGGLSTLPRDGFTPEPSNLRTSQSQPIVDALSTTHAEQLTDASRRDPEPVRPLKEPQLGLFAQPPEPNPQYEAIQHVLLDHPGRQAAAVTLKELQDCRRVLFELP